MNKDAIFKFSELINEDSDYEYAFKDKKSALYNYTVYYNFDRLTYKSCDKSRTRSYAVIVKKTNPDDCYLNS